MIKGKDILQIIVLEVMSFGIGFFIFYYNNTNGDLFSELITFISIMFGFQITAFSILFNSKSLATLHALFDKIYNNRLERLTQYFKFTFYIEFLIIVGLFITKQFNLVNLFVLPILSIIGWCFYKISKVLFEFFRTPRNP